MSCSAQFACSNELGHVVQNTLSSIRYCEKHWITKISRHTHMVVSECTPLTGGIQKHTGVKFFCGCQISVHTLPRLKKKLKAKKWNL